MLHQTRFPVKPGFIAVGVRERMPKQQGWKVLLGGLLICSACVPVATPEEQAAEVRMQPARYTAVDCVEERAVAGRTEPKIEEAEVLVFQSLDVMAEMETLRAGTKPPAIGDRVLSVNCCFLGSRPAPCPQ